MSDTPGPRRMPRPDFNARVMALATSVLENGPPGKEQRREAEALFGHLADAFLMALGELPIICASCGTLHHGWGACCYPCEKAAEKEASEAAIRADERAKAGVNYAGILALLPPELAEKVRAELAQKGITT